MSNDTRVTSCPGPAALQRFLADRMTPEEEATWEAHLGSCATCQHALDTAGGNAEWWTEMRAAYRAPKSPNDDGAAGDDLLRQILPTLAPTDDPAMLGRIGHYEVQGIIGRGSTGIVLKAFDPRLHRCVAIKLLAPEFTANGSARQRFEREARAVAAVAHDHVVPVHAVDEHQGLPYLVMPYVAGHSLRDRIHRDGPLSTREVTRVGLQIARALDAAHGQGIIHRDVKPGNVLVESTIDRVMVTDFGLARILGDATMTRSGAIHGTPHYMSPEQARGDVVDARTDLFSLGSLLYEACTGQPPFEAHTLFGVIRRVCESAPRSIRDLNPEIDAWLEVFIAKLMARDLEQRFANAADVAHALAQELAHLQNPTGTPPPPRPWWPADVAPPSRRSWRRGVVAGIIMAGALGLGAVALQAIQSDDPNAPSGVAVAPEDSDVDVVHRTIDVVSGSTLSVRVDVGDLVITTGDESQITLDVRGRNDAAADGSALADALRVALDADGSAITLRGRFEPDPAAWRDVRYELRVPGDVRLDVATDDGHIDIAARAANVHARAERGHVRIARIDGDVMARTHGGDVLLLEGCGGEAELLARRGSTRVANVSGEAFAAASGGDVWLGRSTGRVAAQTSGGDIYVDGASGAVSAHATNGDVVLWIPDDPVADLRANAASGNVSVLLGPAVRTRIEALGSVESPLVFEPDEASAEATGAPWTSAVVNGGGAALRVSSLSGSITVHQRSGAPPEAMITAAPRDRDAAAAAVSRGGSGDGARSGLGGSGDVARSGLGGSGARSAQRETIPGALRPNEPPVPGVLTTVRFDDPDAVMDGYTIHLPVHFEATRAEPYPILVFLQGGFGVGERIEDVNDWGLARLLRDETDLSTRRNALLRDGFIVLNLHIRHGAYAAHPTVVRRILDDTVRDHHGDAERIYLTGLSRGGHGTWELAAALPGTFAAIAPIGGNAEGVEDWDALRDVAIWISHNMHDRVVSFAATTNAIRELEARFGMRFRRYDQLVVRGTDFLGHGHLLTSAPIRSHDAWTEIYSNPEFYEWLLQHRRTGRNEEPRTD